MTIPGSSISWGLSCSTSPTSSAHPWSSSRQRSRFDVITVPSMRRIPGGLLLRDELEGRPTDPNLVAPPRSDLTQPPLDTGPDQATLQLGHRSGIVQVGLRDPPFDPRPRDAEGPALPGDREGLPSRAEHHVGRTLRLGLLRRADVVHQPGAELFDTRSGQA